MLVVLVVLVDFADALCQLGQHELVRDGLLLARAVCVRHVLLAFAHHAQLRLHLRYLQLNLLLLADVDTALLLELLV